MATMVKSDGLRGLPKPVVAEAGGVRVVLLDSIMVAGEDEAGAIVVSASHGGTTAGEHAARQPLVAAFFNDAGIGRAEAGVAGLDSLDRVGMPGGAVSHESARIGDAMDSWESGVVSRVNRAARDTGFRVGEPLKQQVLRFIEERRP